MVELSVLIAASALFLFALSAVIYVAYRFLALAIAQDMQLLREINFLQRILPAGAPSLLNQFRSVDTKQSEGDFVPTDEDEMAIVEKISKIKSESGYMSEEDEEELAKQIRQGGVTVPD